MNRNDQAATSYLTQQKRSFLFYGEESFSGRFI